MEMSALEVTAMGAAHFGQFRLLPTAASGALSFTPQVIQITVTGIDHPLAIVAPPSSENFKKAATRISP
jgi:hypothetical protein